jgi:hypothetical protein
MKVNDKIEVYFGDGSGCFGPLTGIILDTVPNDRGYFEIEVNDPKFLEYVGWKEGDDSWICSAKKTDEKIVSHVPYDDFLFKEIND